MIPRARLNRGLAAVVQQAKVQHLPLGRALQEHAGSDGRAAMLRLLLPLQRASEQCAWLKVLLDTGAIFQPIAWPPRPQVKVSIGKSAAGLGLAAMLDFDISFALGEQALSIDEWEQLLAAGSGLVRFKGRWVEVDKARLDAVLAHWKDVQRDVSADGDEISFLNGMRLLAGTAPDADDALPAAEAEWSAVVAGDWLRSVLDELHAPDPEKVRTREAKES